MKKFIITLLVANIAIFMWLTFGAQRELPPWQDSFKNTKEVIDQIVPATKSQEFMIAAIKARLLVAEDCSRITIEEYRRSGLPLMLLAIINVVGFFILLMSRKTEPGAVLNLSLPPHLNSMSSDRKSENA